MAQSRPSIMRSLGAFFGHVVKAVRQDVTVARRPEARRQEVRREVREETRASDVGEITLRRTIIEEVEVRPASPTPPHRSSQSNPSSPNPSASPRGSTNHDHD